MTTLMLDGGADTGSFGCATWRRVMTTTVCLARRGPSYSDSLMVLNWRRRTYSTRLLRSLYQTVSDMPRWPVQQRQLRYPLTTHSMEPGQDLEFDLTILTVYQPRFGSHHITCLLTSLLPTPRLTSVNSSITCCWSVLSYYVQMSMLWDIGVISVLKYF